MFNFINNSNYICNFKFNKLIFNSIIKIPLLKNIIGLMLSLIININSVRFFLI